MNKTHYLKVAGDLFRRVPGPVALIWGLCTVGQIIISLILAGQVASFVATMNTPDPKMVTGLLLGLWVLYAFQRGLYGPMRHLARSEEQLSLATVIGSAIGRMGSVMTTQFLCTVILIGASFVCVTIGGTVAFIPIYLLSFSLAPALYFTAARRISPAQAILKSLAVSYRHWRYILGVPAVFLCLSPLVSNPASLSAPLEAITNSLNSTDPLTLLRYSFFYMLYRYTRWLATSSVFVAIDNH